MKKTFKTMGEWYEYAEREMALIQKKYETADIKGMQAEINALLLAQEFDMLEKIENIVNSALFLQIESLSASLRILSKMVLISIAEKEAGLCPILTRIHSLAEMEYVYNKTIFYFRRIEFSLPLEYCIEFSDWMEEWKFSGVFLIILLQYGDLYRRQQGTRVEKIRDVGEQLGNMLIQTGYQEEGLQIITWLKKTKSGEENENG